MTEARQFDKIFLIDDDKVFNLIHAKTIARERITKETEAFAGGADALLALNGLFYSHTGAFPDIIFLDINMPGMDGWDFLDEFEKRYSSLKEKCKVYMLSSSIDPRDIERSESYATVRNFISKPLTGEKLRKLLA